MNNFLAIDTSSRYLTVCAHGDKKSVVRHLPQCAMKHSVILMEEVEKALNEAELSLCDCDFFSAVTGPGSFTGIRIGIAAAKGFAVATGKPLVSVTSFELIAYNVTDENFCAVIDAGRSHFYVCGFGPERQVTLAPSYMSENAVNALGLPLYGFEDLQLENYRKIEVKDCLCGAVLSHKDRAGGDMRALYVRKSQAEEARGEA